MANVGPHDQSLLQAAVSGDTQAANKLFTRYQSDMFAVAFRILRNRDDALGATQEASSRAFERLDQCQTQVRPWLVKIVYNEAVNILRKRDTIRRRNENLRPQVSDHCNDAAPPTQASERRAELRSFVDRVREFVATLPTKQQQAFWMKFDDELSTKAIAKTLQTTVGAIHLLLYRARGAFPKDLHKEARRILRDDL